MDREQMIEVLVGAMVQAGASFSTARRRAWRLSGQGLRRELQMRGLEAYEDPQLEEEDEAEEGVRCAAALLGWSQAPVYVD